MVKLIFRSVSAVTRVEDIRQPGDKWVGDSFMEGNLSKLLISPGFYFDVVAQCAKVQQITGIVFSNTFIQFANLGNTHIFVNDVKKQTLSDRRTSSPASISSGLQW